MTAINYAVLAAVIFAIVAMLQLGTRLIGCRGESRERIDTSVGELDRVSCCQLACLARIYNNTRLNGGCFLNGRRFGASIGWGQI